MRKKLALITGTNSVSALAYNGWQGILEGTVNDAEGLTEAFVKRGFDVAQLLDQELTTQEFRKLVTAMANSTKEGDICFISYSGHGAQTDDLSGDEKDGYDESICLFNGQLYDDEMNTLLSKFKKGVTVILFFDSCHSETVYKSSQRGLIAKAAPSFAVKGRTWRKKNEKVVADVVILSGAADDKYSYDGAIRKVEVEPNKVVISKHGYFSLALIETLEDNHKINLRNIIHGVKVRMPDFQKPYFNFVMSFWHKVKIKYTLKF